MEKLESKNLEEALKNKKMLESELQYLLHAMKQHVCEAALGCRKTLHEPEKFEVAHKARKDLENAIVVVNSEIDYFKSLVGVMQKYKYCISNSGDRDAGINGYTDMITIIVDSGDPGGEVGEFKEYMQKCLLDWFDGAKVISVDEEKGGIK